MALLPILIAPDPILKKRALLVDWVDQEVVRLMDDMLETMYAAPGIGLAAPQVGVAKRILVADIAPAGIPQPLCMANPEIVACSPETRMHQEGCLSFPDQFADVERPAQIRVRYLDRNGENRELTADDLLATCLQHEIDHLDGVVFIDRISTLKRSLILRRMQKRYGRRRKNYASAA